jgi:hypothetical protein
MKLWSSQVYESVRGYSKKAKIDFTLDTLASYGDSEQRWDPQNRAEQMALDEAIADARRIFTPREKLHRYGLHVVADHMNLDSSAGFSFPNKKKSEVVQEAYDVASYIQHMAQKSRGFYIPPCKLASRGHLHADDEPKSRPVWVFPVEWTMLEGKWAMPYYQFLEEHVEQIHFGEGSMMRLATHLMSDLATHNENGELTLDWSKFDARVPNWLIDIAFDILYSSFDEEYVDAGDELIYTGPKGKSMNARLFTHICTYFKKTKIMLHDGTIVAKQHGIPSGSFFTQAIGSIVNYIVVKFFNYKHGWKAVRSRVLGDDSSLLIPNFHYVKINPDGLALEAKRLFGFVLNPKKLRISISAQGRKFLGYSVEGFRFVRDDEEWIKMVLYPERDVQFLEQSASRVFAYYILGGCNSEIYCSFFRQYFRHYPQVLQCYLPLTKGLKRLLKYVVQIPIQGFYLPSLSRLDVTRIPYNFSFGDGLYRSPC